MMDKKGFFARLSYFLGFRTSGLQGPQGEIGESGILDLKSVFEKIKKCVIKILKKGGDKE